MRWLPDAAPCRAGNGRQCRSMPDCQNHSHEALEDCSVAWQAPSRQICVDLLLHALLLVQNIDSSQRCRASPKAVSAHAFRADIPFVVHTCVAAEGGNALAGSDTSCRATRGTAGHSFEIPWIPGSLYMQKAQFRFKTDLASSSVIKHFSR